MLAATLLTCLTLVAVDGDTIKCDGVNMRDMGDGQPFISGYDTPEIWSSHCPRELDLGRAAKTRMDELLQVDGVQVFDSGEKDDTQQHRPLVWVKLPDGRSVGSILIAEGFARKWSPEYKANWCE